MNTSTLLFVKGLYARWAAFLIILLSVGSSFAGWQKFPGVYTGTWKSSDTDGKSYSGKATMKISAGKDNTLKISIKTVFLGNPINAKGRAPASGKLAVTVSNPVLGTVTGQAKSTASGSNGKIAGTTILYNGITTLNSKLHISKNDLTAKGTLVRVFPFTVPQTLTFSFKGKKK